MSRKKEPRERVRIRQQRFRDRRLAASRRNNDRFFRRELETYYAVREINLTQFVSAEEFYSESLIRDLLTLKEFLHGLYYHTDFIETAVVVQNDGAQRAIIRPRYVLGGRP